VIHRITVNDPEKAAVPWWSKVKWLQGMKSLDFGPGLNVLFGPNGSGKSTVLTLLARMLCCEQGDTQMVSSTATQDLYGFDRVFPDGVLPEHDGSPIVHYDPAKTVGLFGGGAAFDWDFGDLGIQNTRLKASTGQTAIVRMGRVLEAAVKGAWSEVEFRQWTPESLKEQHPELPTFLKGDGTKQCPTLLMDEPSRSLDLNTEIRLMKILADVAAGALRSSWQPTASLPCTSRTPSSSTPSPVTAPSPGRRQRSTSCRPCSGTRNGLRSSRTTSGRRKKTQRSSPAFPDNPPLEPPTWRRWSTRAVFG